MEEAMECLMGRMIKDTTQRSNGSYLDDCNKLVPLDDYNCSTKRINIAPNVLGLGINAINIMRVCERSNKKQEKGVSYGVLRCYFYLTLDINPRTLSNPASVNTIELYKASDANNAKLVEAFRNTMINALCRLDDSLMHLCSLPDWNCCRIDYTLNMKFPTNEEKNIFWCLTHKTSAYNRTECKRIKGMKMMEQSAAEGNKSYKTMFYDKLEECKDTYQNLREPERSRLLAEADKVIRMEHQAFKGAIGAMVARYKLPNRGIMWFLSETIAKNELLCRYDKMVGTGDFYKREEAKRIILKNISKPSEQEKLIQLLELIAQKRHIDIAREVFTCKVTKDSDTEENVGGRTFPLAHGTAKTFSERIKKIRALGINPMLITDNSPQNCLANPRQLIEEIEV
ncbi:hypothetical protein [Selenomonas sp. AB3002]|uniref:hypothetical protein n=1 Tax=Selenomonas sp. AB3002 TaxID=1392502 RepID=UPI00163B1A22